MQSVLRAGSGQIGQIGQSVSKNSVHSQTGGLGERRDRNESTLVEGVWDPRELPRN